MMRLWLAFAAVSLSAAILPPDVVLNGREAFQQLTLEEDRNGSATWSSSNPSVVTVDKNGVAHPIADGEATITARANGHESTLKVRVTNFNAPFAWSFKNHVVPVLTKAGCNQGACHGALAGKNGFKLTLRGYDPDADYDTLTRSSVARRVSLSDPASSLMLLKPTFAVRHGGGKRFGTNSLEYRVLAEWIAAGAQPPDPNEPEILGLEVFPASATLAPGDTQQLAVRAKFSDGSKHDVTRWVKYSSNNEATASVDDSGRVKMNSPGEAAVTLWYSSRVSYARFTAPYENEVAANAYTKFPRANYIDDLIVDKLRKLKIAPSKPADDATFLRRAFLDTAGILPTAAEAERFLADQSPDKRAKLIDSLLERPEFVDYWAYKWSDLLLVSTRKLNKNAMWAFYNWIRDSVQENKPWDKFAREIFTSSGSSRENGALNYFALHKDPIDLSENITEAFLGQRITCARCHNHPLEKWTQKQYFQFANLVSRVGIKNGTEVGDVIVYAKASGDINYPKLMRPLPPTPLDGTPIALDSTEDRRLALSAWLTSPQNPYFARSLVNRVFANFMGRGLINPVDDVRATNPASNEELLTALTQDFVSHSFDVKRLIRTIMTSSAYQLASEANATNQNDNTFYSRYIIRRLPAEVILDAYSQVTGVPTMFSSYPVGTRALQLPDTQVKSDFLTVFGRPARQICDSGERSSDPNIAQALHVINGDTLNRKLSAAEAAPSTLLKLGLPDSQLIDKLYLSALSRHASGSEREAMLKNLASAPADSRQQAVEDIYWALLTSKEFLFNH